jgi:hypothetical protein
MALLGPVVPVAADFRLKRKHPAENHHGKETLLQRVDNSIYI